MAFKLVEYNTQSISLDEVKNRYPDGYHSVDHGCYYYLDQDGEVGYFIELANGDFEDEVNYVDLDTMDDIDRAEVEAELVNLG